MAHWTHFEREQEKDVKRLISSVSGLCDESEKNYQLALQYAWSNFRFHRFLDVSSHNIHRTLEGIYEKFVIHSDLSKAESWKLLTEEFLNLPLPSTEGTKSDAHYAILSLLLGLSDSPVKNDFIEKPRKKQAEEEEPFDWGKYLMEGEDIGLSADDDTPEWSDVSEEEDDQETLSREDSGIQVDRTPQDDGEKKATAPVVSWKVGEPDARTWLEQHVVPQYWTPRANRFSHSLHLHSNLAAVWDQHLYTTDPLYTPDDKTFVTETQVIRETLWLLSGVKKLFIFHLNDGKVTVRNDIVVTHMTHNCLRSVLEQIAAYGQVVFRLQKFMDDVTGHCAENSLPGTLPTTKKGTEAPFRTYQAFMWALYKYFMSFKEDLSEIEKCIINKDETITLAMVVEKLAPRLAQLKVLHKVFSTGIAEVPPDTRNVVRASHLLNTLYKAILEYDNVGEASEQTVEVKVQMDVTSEGCVPAQSDTIQSVLPVSDCAVTHPQLVTPSGSSLQTARNVFITSSRNNKEMAQHSHYKIYIRSVISWGRQIVTKTEKPGRTDRRKRHSFRSCLTSASGIYHVEKVNSRHLLMYCDSPYCLLCWLDPFFHRIIHKGGNMDNHNTLVSLLFFLWVETVRPYLEIVDEWIVHGNLFDPAKEFIIQRNKDVPVDHRDFWYATYTLYSVSEKTENEDKMSDNASASSGSDQAPASRQHTMVSFLRPVLKQIIMAGKSMQLLKNLKCRLSQRPDSSRDADRKSLYNLFLESVQSRLQHGKESGTDAITEQQVNKQSLIKMQSIVAKYLELNDVHDPLLAINFARLYLEQSDFLETFTCEDISVDRSSESVTCQSFELTLRSCLYPHIDKQYLECCGNLMQTLKEDYKLIEYLKSMRNFFLLEAGDTMYDFYTSIFDKIREKEQWQNIVFLNVQLQEAVSQRYLEDSTRLSIFFENVDLAKKKLPVHTLDGLVLSYKVPWPVDIVISSECQKIYNQIFLLLLLIKWAKYSLDVLQFNELVSTAEKESPKEESGSEHQQQLPSHLVTPAEPKEQQIHRMFLLRVKLMHFVNSLHNYMMTRILHSTGLEFQHQVEEAKDLDQLIKIHYRYLSTIHDRCLLREKVSSVKEAIMKVMNVVLMFADRWHAGFGAWKAESILKMESDFTNCHKFLVKVLNKAVCRGSFPHLESLALSLMAGMDQS